MELTPFSVGDTSSNGGFPIAMLVYRSVILGAKQKKLKKINQIQTSSPQ